MSSLLILLGLLSVATLLSRKGALVGLVGGGSAPPLIVLGILIGPAGLAYLDAGTIRGLVPAVDVGITWLAFLIGARVASGDGDSDGEGDGESAQTARALAFFSAALVAAAAFAALSIATSLSLPPPLGRHVALLPLLPLVVAMAAVRNSELEHDLDIGADGARAAAPPSSSLRVYGKSVELLALAAAIGAFAITGEVRGVVVIALGLFAALLVHLLARQGTIPPVVAVLGAVLLLTGLARLANVPAAVAGLLAGAAFSLPRGAEPVAAKLVGTERPMRIVVTVLVAAAAGLDGTGVIIGAALGIVIALLHCAVTLITAPTPAPKANAADAANAAAAPKAVAVARRMSFRERLRALPAASLTPILIIAGFASAGAPGASALLAIALVALAVRDGAAFVVVLAARRQRGAT